MDKSIKNVGADLQVCLDRLKTCPYLFTADYRIIL